jgi:hypothetical protein
MTWRTHNIYKGEPNKHCRKLHEPNLKRMLPVRASVAAHSTETGVAQPIPQYGLKEVDSCIPHRYFDIGAASNI